jgi:hypothetical protein
MNPSSDVRRLSRLTQAAARGNLAPFARSLVRRYGRRRALAILARSVALLARTAKILAASRAC